MCDIDRSKLKGLVFFVEKEYNFSEYVLNTKLEYCEKCERLINDNIILSNLLYVEKNQLYIPSFGIGKLGLKDKCFFCNKYYQFSTLKDLFFDSWIDKWKFYFSKINIKKLLDIQNLDYFIMYILDFENIKINNFVKKKLFRFNFFTIESAECDSFNENMYYYILKWYDILIDTPNHIVVKDLFVLQINSLNNELALMEFENYYKIVYFFSIFSSIFLSVEYNSYLYEFFEEGVLFSNLLFFSLFIILDKENLEIIWDVPYIDLLPDKIRLHMIEFGWTNYEYNLFKFFLYNNIYLNVDIDTIFFFRRYLEFKYEYKRIDEILKKKKEIDFMEMEFKRDKEIFFKKKRKGKKQQQSIDLREKDLNEEKDILHYMEISFIEWQEHELQLKRQKENFLKEYFINYLEDDQDTNLYRDLCELVTKKRYRFKEEKTVEEKKDVEEYNKLLKSSNTTINEMFLLKKKIDAQKWKGKNINEEWSINDYKLLFIGEFSDAFLEEYNEITTQYIYVKEHKKFVDVSNIDLNSIELDDDDVK